MIKAVLDRFENSKAVLLLGDMEERVVFPRKYFSHAKEGDYFTLKISYDEAETLRARQDAEALQKNLTHENE